MIKVTNLCKAYGSTVALDNVSFEVDDGHIYGLLGPNGAGKSTTMNIISGSIQPDSGHVILSGMDITKMKERELSKLRLETIGFIFQSYNLVQNLSVEDNILLPELTKGRTRAELKKDLDEILEITGLSDKRKSMPNELSGGQQQRTAVARAVIASPQLILADEATGNLDSVSGEEIMKLFARINKEKNITILQVTHSEECAAYGTRTVRLANGQIV